VLLIVFKQPGANVINTVNRIDKALPSLKADIPPRGQRQRPRRSNPDHPRLVRDVEITLDHHGLVVIVIFLFLRDIRRHADPQRDHTVCLLSTCAVDAGAGLQPRQPVR